MKPNVVIFSYWDKKAPERNGIYLDEGHKIIWMNRKLRDANINPIIRRELNKDDISFVLLINKVSEDEFKKHFE